MVEAVDRFLDVTLTVPQYSFPFTLGNDCYLDLDLSVSDQSQPVTLFVSDQLLNITYEVEDPNYPEYDGSYVVDPKRTVQILNTYKRAMEDNVTVKEIYFSQVENLSGGKTAFIGKE